MMINKEKLKQTWLYRHHRRLVTWPKYFLIRLRLKRQYFWMTWQKNWMIDPCTDKRQKYWKKCGVKATGNFHVGADVYFDAQCAHYLTIDDDVWISARTVILLHKRDISNYCVGDIYTDQPTKPMPVHICSSAAIGMGCIILPGVTIGQGAVIGAGSVVTKDIPAWTVAVGHPAKVVRQLRVKREP
jgi:serine acetyltransferase